MHLNPYGADAVLLAVDLVNSPPATAAELVARCVDAGLVVDRSAVDLDDVRAMLARWTAIVDAPAGAERASLLNAMLAESSAHPRLTDHAGDGWHIHYRPDGIGLAKVLGSLIAVGTALHLAGRGMDRLGRCRICPRVYADVSRGGRQAYCSPACANRDAVRRHRARHPA